jgi:hypothetical protein
MQVEMDPDLQAVASFMQERFASDRLAPIADELFRLAPLLWGHFDRSEVRPLALVPPPISGCDQPRR